MNYILIQNYPLSRYLIILYCCSAILSLSSYLEKMSPMEKREEIYHMTAKEMARLKVAERLIVTLPTII